MPPLPTDLAVQELLHPFSHDVSTPGDQQRLFVGVVKDLESKGVNQQSVVQVDQIEPVDHSITAEPS